MQIREAYVRIAEAFLIAVIIGVFVWTGDMFLNQEAEERGARGGASRAQLAAKSDAVIAKVGQLQLDLSHLKACRSEK